MVYFNMNDVITYIGIIPARYGSSRFPGKPLALINGKSMIRRVYERASKAITLTKVIVATDDERIKKHVDDFGGNVVMTSSEHASGTERCHEAFKMNSNTDTSNQVIINIQGDEPFISPEQINELAYSFSDPNVDIATLIKKIEKPEALSNPNHVKVITDPAGFAIYFSRSVIPYLRNVKEMNTWPKQFTYYKHLGIYAYRDTILDQIVHLPTAKLEKAESLEQLRWLENGYRIKTILTDHESISIDAPEDIEKMN